MKVQSGIHTIMLSILCIFFWLSYQNSRLQNIKWNVSISPEQNLFVQDGIRIHKVWFLHVWLGHMQRNFWFIAQNEVVWKEYLSNVFSNNFPHPFKCNPKEVCLKWPQSKLAKVFHKTWSQNVYTYNGLHFHFVMDARNLAKITKTHYIYFCDGQD